ncbi:hypothetical protein HAX54_040377, partial [Datura stramonium]|nr:hypothetical protein [Datura stramonium]
INEVRSRKGKNHNNAGTALDQRVADPEVRIAASGHKKAEGGDFEHLTSGPSGKPPMQNCVPPVGRRYNTYHLKHWSLSGEPPTVRRSSSRTAGQQLTDIQCVNGRHGNVWFNLWMITFGDSPVGSGETPMERRSKASLSSGHCLDPVLHWRFVDQYRRLTTLSPVHSGSTQSSVSHR